MAASPYRMVSVDEAVTTVLHHTRALPPERVPLGAALGRVLAEDITAGEPHPPFRASIKDGYAVRTADGPGDFPVVAAARAAPRDGPAPVLEPGTVAYITTGAPLPDGADAVVQVENTQDVITPPTGGADGQRRVRIVVPAKAPGEDVRQIGSDVAHGQVVLRAGDRICAAETGILASVGAANVCVHSVPTAAVLSTGDELSSPDTPAGALPFGSVRDSNRPMLLAAVQEAGFRAVDLGIARDEPGGLKAALDRALAGAHVLISSGGVSMGDRDLVKPLLEAAGVVHFGRCNMKPGKPLTFAVVPRPPGTAAAQQQQLPPLLVFGLPGNPVSSLVTFHLVVVPCLRKMAGWTHPQLRRVAAVLAQPLKLDPERPEYHRATLTWSADAGSGGGGGGGGGFVAHSTGGQISSRLLSARSAVALLELPAAAGVLPAGTAVSALLIHDLGAADGLASTANITPRVPEGAPPGGAASAPPPLPPPPPVPRIGVLTISDRASAGVYEDVSGPAIVAVLREYLATPCEFLTRVIPDEVPLIVAALREFAASGACLVCTTGGTGPAPRDVTPEAMAQACERMLPGFGEAMRAASLRDVPTAILSRQEAGTLGRTLVINIPGKPAAVRTCLNAVWAAVPYCIDLMGGPYLEGKEGAVKVFRPSLK